MHVAIDIVEEENANGYIPLTTSHASLEQVPLSPMGSETPSSPSITEFFCHICQENISIYDDSVQLTACGHWFCISCIERYLEHRIREGHVHLTCFHQEHNIICNQTILEEDIKMLMSPYLWNKYLIFKFKKANATSRECPKCHHHQAFPQASTKLPLCTCEKCSYSYCFAHSDAHVIIENNSVACTDYQQQTDRADPWSVALIRETCQACPNCGQYVEKDGGCNQILCLSCRTTFCWLCLEKIDDTAFPVHYQWWNVRGCPGNQMVDLETLTKSERFCSMALRVFFIVVVGPPALLITIVASLLCCCCIPIVHMFETTPQQSFTTCLCISGYIVIAPILALISLFTCSWFCVRDCREPNELVNTLTSESVSTLPRYERDVDT